MNSIQQRKVEMIRREAEKLRGENCEFKKFEVHDMEYFIALVVEVGMIGDEGTLAQCFCRDRVQVFIGPRGGMRIPISRVLKNGKYKHYYKPYTGFLSASIDQRR